MTSLFISDFRLGLDTRKSFLTAEPGSLRTADNVVITPGGEIVKRKAFVLVAAVPGNTYGLHGLGSTSTPTNTTGAWAPAAPPPQLVVFADTDATVAAIPSFTLGDSTSVIFVVDRLAHVAATGWQMLTRIISVVDYGLQRYVAALIRLPTATGGLSSEVLVNWWNGAPLPAYGTTPPPPGGYAPFSFGQKMYRMRDSVLSFSGVGDPSVNNPLNPAGTGPNTVNPGAGFIDTSRLAGESQTLVGAGTYYRQVALFSRRVCLLYTLDPDPALSQVQQVLNIGAVSAGSILQFGAGDVLFLSDNGIRSLRARNASLAASVVDVGSPIDSIIQLATQLDPSSAFVAKAVIEPRTGRYWLAFGRTIYVLNYWPSAKISAWTTFTLPFTVSYITVAGGRVYVRSGNNIYLYGGLDGDEYDNCTGTVVTPHHDAGTPTTAKDVETVSAMLEGAWSVDVGMSVETEGFYEPVATLTGSTYGMQRIPFAGYGTHIGFRLTTTHVGPAKLGAVSVRFQKTEEK